MYLRVSFFYAKHHVWHIYPTIMLGDGIDYGHAVAERNVLRRNIRISYNGIQGIKIQSIG